MAKTQNVFVCQSCGCVQPRWSGRCDGCGAWDTLVEELREHTPKGLSGAQKGKKIEFLSLDSEAAPAPRFSTGIAELDRVLGGGLVQGSATLIGGDPGIGKSTLILQTACLLGAEGIRTAYISGEESAAQIQLRARRLAMKTANVQLATANSVRDILESLDGKDAPEVVMIDSIQTMFVDSIDAAPGSVSQVRAASHELIRFAKRNNIAVILVGHVTKDGQIAGPRVMEHMVDTVLYFEGERGHAFRILRAVKNRFGATDEIGVFSMGEKGLEEVANPSSLFIGQQQGHVSGSAIFAGMEGTRPLLVEIQALVAPSPLATPRRAVIGWDAARLAMVLAVLEARAGLRFSDKEVYLNVAGGLKISEPAADLAVAAALISSLYNVPTDRNAVFFGEIGLSGEIRAAARRDARLKEAQKLGFSAAILPLDKTSDKEGLSLHSLETVQELLEIVAKSSYDEYAQRANG